MSEPTTLDLPQAFARYEAIRHRLPRASFAAAPRRAGCLMAVARDLDAVVLDSFGVLNVGETAIDGAADCLRELRGAGVAICILTNAASYPRPAALEKYRALELDVTLDEVVSSRDVAAAHLARVAGDVTWAAICDGTDAYGDIDARVASLLDGGIGWAEAEAFLFLSSARWTPALQDRLAAELSRRPRPLVVANPDLVAPRECGLTLEPGFWGHDIWDRTGLAPAFFGKPYGAAFEMVRDRLGGGRMAMVGDTLHTDILGGRAAGMDTVLVAEHGLFRGVAIGDFVARSGIVPDALIPSI